ncbi:MAG TPA: aspartate-semialdehyde dehydrogenase [Clostridia bacterium]|nr:aspartate-semialdehyde dehydrogenase [Clostridia bacterium]
MKRTRVAVCGATGMVGQIYVAMLADHPWFELVGVAASERSAGNPYEDVARWYIQGEIPTGARSMTVLPCTAKAIAATGATLVFSALPSDVAGPIEQSLADAGMVVVADTASHRMDVDVPLIIPEVDADHLEALSVQRKGGKRGFIVTGPNCSTAGLVLSLKPLQTAFGIRRVVVVTMQALSGAGYAGVPSMAIVDNLIPYIRGEEQKMERETRKMLGSWLDGSFVPADIPVSASCNRVAVLEGHTESVLVELGRPASPEEVGSVMHDFQGEPQRLHLPSAPDHPIIVRSEPDRPQPRLDRMAGEPARAHGMAAVVGGIRADTAFETGIKYTVLSHNTIRGAAGNAILTAELLVAKGLL